MSDKITVTFEVDSKGDLDLFTAEVRKRFEYSCKKASSYNACSTESETNLFRKYKKQANTYSGLYLACIKGLLDEGRKNAK